MWKVRKVMGKMTLEYLSISLARIPKILSGGAWGGLSWISTTLGCWCWWKMPIILHTPPWKKGEVNENIQLRRGQKKGVNLARLSFFYGYPMHCGAEGAFFGTPGCSDTECKIIVRAVFCIWCQTWVFLGGIGCAPVVVLVEMEVVVVQHLLGIHCSL